MRPANLSNRFIERLAGEASGAPRATDHERRGTRAEPSQAARGWRRRPCAVTGEASCRAGTIIFVGFWHSTPTVRFETPQTSIVRAVQTFYLILYLFFCRLRKTLAARLAEIDEIVSEFDRVSERIEELRQLIEVSIAKVRTLYVFGENEDENVKALEKEVSDLVERTKTFTEESRKRYGGSAPADVAQELSALELSSEALAAAMEEKEREWKRARTARFEYATDVDDVQTWLRAAELTARERTLPPEPYRERIVATRQEIPSVADRVERLTRNARAIVEGSRDASERQLVQSTVTALSEQFSSVCSELEARQAAVEDACDAVARFLALLEKVLLWVETQRAFLARPLPLADLQEVQQKQTEYGVGIPISEVIVLKKWVGFNVICFVTERAQELQAASQKSSGYGERDRSNREGHESRGFALQIGGGRERDRRCRKEIGEDGP